MQKTQVMPLFCRPFCLFLKPIRSFYFDVFKLTLSTKSPHYKKGNEKLDLKRNSFSCWNFCSRSFESLEKCGVALKTCTLADLELVERSWDHHKGVIRKMKSPWWNAFSITETEKDTLSPLLRMLISKFACLWQVIASCNEIILNFITWLALLINRRLKICFRRMISADWFVYS